LTNIGGTELKALPINKKEIKMSRPSPFFLIFLLRIGQKRKIMMTISRTHPYRTESGGEIELEIVPYLIRGKDG